MRRTLWYITLLLMTIAFWLLLAIGYPGHLHAAEGNSLFLYTGQFASEAILAPGGLATYIGCFTVQFFYCPFVGALMVALLAAALAAGVAQFCKSTRSLPLTFIPSLIYIILLMDSKWTVAGLAGLLCAVWTYALIFRIPSRSLKTVSAIVALPFVWQFFLRAKFYTYAVAPQGIWWALVIGTAAICLVCSLLKQVPRGKGVFSAFLYVLMMALCAFGVSRKYEKLDEEIDRYTYLVRIGDWDRIIEKATGATLNSPLSTNALNLALEMKGRLGDDMFHYFQKGPRSLINFEERKISSEVLFHLGFVNEAMHQTFEDMAGNPGRERGVYHLTRLARCASVDSIHHRLCKSYLAVLDKTLFYRDYDAASEVTPEMEPCEDFLFDFNDFSRMTACLSIQRPLNGRVRDYLAASLLLDKDLKTFFHFFSEEQNPPRSHLQALQVGMALEGEPAAPELQSYVDAYNACRGNGARMRKWSDTYWYYYNFR